MTIRNGLVSVQDQQLLVRDPEEGGTPARVITPPYCTLIVNGTPSVGEVIVSSGNAYTIHCDRIAPETKIEVEVSADTLSVSMTVHLSDGQRYRVADASWTEQLEFRLLGETIHAIPPTPANVYDVLRERGFAGQIDQSAVSELVSARSSMTRIVVRGRPPKPGEFPSFEILPIHQHNDVLRRWRQLDTLKAGTVVARYVTGEAGEDGVDVYGRVIPAPMNGDPLPHLGEGLSFQDNQVIAQRDGRFVRTRTAFDVIPQLIVNEDIVAKEGFIEFDGDLTTTGSIMDGSIVRASGVISVSGGVYGAHVVGFGGVQVAKGIVNSQVVAGSSGGYSRAWQEAVATALRTAVDLREQISEAIRVQLQARKEAEQGQRRMQTAHQVQQAKNALTECVIALKQALGSLCSEIAPDEKVDDRWAELARLIRSRWLTIQAADIRAELLSSLETALTQYDEYVRSVFQEEPAHLVAESVVSSTIHAAGDITVDGRGVVSSTVTCGGTFRTSGFVRGGSVIAEKEALIRELGTALGSETRVKVNDVGGRIEVAVRHPNTWLEVGISEDISYQTERDVVKRAF